MGWHCDEEPLFGEYGEDKLIVSVSVGSSAVFKWRRQPCPNGEGHLCCLGHGDILVMDGQCQDKLLHRTDPCLEQERINVTFRWIKQYVSSCTSGMLFANVCAGFISSCHGECSCFGSFLASSRCLLCIWRVPVLLGLHRCASSWTRPLGGGRWGHYLCNLW